MDRDLERGGGSHVEHGPVPDGPVGLNGGRTGVDPRLVRLRLPFGIGGNPMDVHVGGADLPSVRQPPSVSKKDRKTSSVIHACLRRKQSPLRSSSEYGKDVRMDLPEIPGSCFPSSQASRSDGFPPSHGPSWDSILLPRPRGTPPLREIHARTRTVRHPVSWPSPHTPKAPPPPPLREETPPGRAFPSVRLSARSTTGSCFGKARSKLPFRVRWRAMMAARAARLRPIKADRRVRVRVVAQERENREPKRREGAGKGAQRVAAAVAVAAAVFAVGARPARATNQAQRCVRAKNEQARRCGTLLTETTAAAWM